MAGLLQVFLQNLFSISSENSSTWELAAIPPFLKSSFVLNQTNSSAGSSRLKFLYK